MNRFTGETEDVPHAPITVIGYHGCTDRAADIILAGSPFRSSMNKYDWLGNGIYFWEFGLYRALDWAEGLYGTHRAILQATITLGNCLNLLDTGHFDDIAVAYDTYISRAAELGIELPSNKGKAHYLDRAVIEFYCQDYAANSKVPFQTVRGCFLEGTALFEGSRIRRENHIQIAVRDVNCISDVKMIK